MHITWWDIKVTGVTWWDIKVTGCYSNAVVNGAKYNGQLLTQILQNYIKTCGSLILPQYLLSFFCVPGPVEIRERLTRSLPLWIGEGNGNPLQYSCLQNPMDGGAWKAEVHGVAKSQTRLSDFTFTFHFHALEKEMATHSSVLAWRIPGTGSLVGCHLWGRTELDATEVT